MILCLTYRSVIIREASPGQQIGTDAESHCQILGRECKLGVSIKFLPSEFRESYKEPERI